MSVIFLSPDIQHKVFLPLLAGFTSLLAIYILLSLFVWIAVSQQLDMGMIVQV